MRNWPYAWALVTDADSAVRGKVGVAQLPRGPSGRRAATLGGQQLAVSRYSHHAELATQLVVYLTSRDEQKRRAQVGAFNPTIPALYQDVEVLAANPLSGQLFDMVQDAVPRPSRVSGRRYNRISAAFWNAVHAVLSGNAEAAPELEALEHRLLRISRGGRW
jgi:trehalose/maltose transport system substrate-binding protein